LRIGGILNQPSRQLDRNRSRKEALQHGPLHLLQRYAAAPQTRLRSGPGATNRPHNAWPAVELRWNRESGDARIVRDGSSVSGPSSPLEKPWPNGSIQNRSNSIPRAPALCRPGLKDGKGMMPLSVLRAPAGLQSITQVERDCRDPGEDQTPHTVKVK